MTLNENYLPSGFGEATGDSLVTSSPWYTSGSAIYVDSVNGDDSNSGLERLRPMKTFGAAVDSAFSGDFVVLAADFDETLTATQVVRSGITIVGAGSSNGQPTAKLTMNSASGVLISLSSGGGSEDVQIRNILFPPNVQTNASPRIGSASSGDEFDRLLIKGCRFESGATDTGAAVDINDSDDVVIDDCEFVVTSTTTSPGPALTNSQIVSNLVVRDTSFDGGTVGYSAGLAIDMDGTTILFLRMERISLLNGADAVFDSAASGRINPITTTGNSRIFVTFA